jgi:D-3-phosphoglycerate dehydrogenase
LDGITANVLKKGKKLKVVTKYGVGLDNIDLKEAEKLGVKITFTPGANNESVADLAFSLILSLVRNVNKLDSIVRNNLWEKVIGAEIYGKTMGIIGTGAIGKGVAKRARGFDMEVLAYDINPDNDFANKNGITYVDKKTLLEKSDFISLHVPLTDEMYHFIDEEELNIMKETAYVVNCRCSIRCL